MYVVLNTLSKYTYFYMSKSVTLYTFLPIFKIVESLQCFLKSSFFGHLNIEKLIEKEFLEPVIRNYFDISLVSETKLDSSFLGSQFSILGYRLFRKDRVRHGTGLILYVNQGIPPKTINTFNFPNSLEVLPLEINLRNKKILAIAAINLHHLMMNIFWISYTMLSVFIALHMIIFFSKVILMSLVMTKNSAVLFLEIILSKHQLVTWILILPPFIILLQI